MAAPDWRRSMLSRRRMGSSIRHRLAPSSGWPYRWACKAPSRSVQRRSDRLACRSRRRCSASLPAALTLATSSLSSGSELRLALSISSAALAGSAATPSETAAACSDERSPARAAAATSGWSASRRPVSRARLAAAGLMPAWSASCSDAERYPACCQLLPSAERAAASALIDAADASIRAHNPTTSPACAAVNVRASNRPA